MNIHLYCFPKIWCFFFSTDDDDSSASNLLARSFFLLLTSACFSFWDIMYPVEGKKGGNSLLPGHECKGMPALQAWDSAVNGVRRVQLLSFFLRFIRGHQRQLKKRFHFKIQFENQHLRCDSVYCAVCVSHDTWLLLILWLPLSIIIKDCLSSHEEVRRDRPTRQMTAVTEYKMSSSRRRRRDIKFLMLWWCCLWSPFSFSCLTASSSLMFVVKSPFHEMLKRWSVVVVNHSRKEEASQEGKEGCKRRRRIQEERHFSWHLNTKNVVLLMLMNT